MEQLPRFISVDLFMCILPCCMATVDFLAPILCLPRLSMIVCFLYNGLHQCMLLQGLSQKCSCCCRSLTTCFSEELVLHSL